MKNNLLCCITVILLGHGALCAAQQAPASSTYRDTLDRYCVTCHNDALRTAGLSLQHTELGNVGAGPATWEKVLRKLRARIMPPAGMPRPDQGTYAGFTDYLEANLDRHGRANPQPGRPSMRRLNRNEYFNAVRDLLAVEINDDTLLPEDDTMYGFDNVGTVLTLSPLLAEQYITAARKIRYQALGDPGMQPEFHSYTLPKTLLQDSWAGEGLPFGSRGGFVIQHHFPMDGDYVFQIRLQRNTRDYIRGLLKGEHQLDVRIDGEVIKSYTVGGQKLGKSATVFSTAAQGNVDQEHYERDADAELEFRIPVRAGTRSVSVAFLDERSVAEEPLYSRKSMIDYSQYKGGAPAVRAVSVGGPYDARVSNDSASRQKIFVCQPANDNDVACAREIVSSLARRAYRRPPSEREVAGLMGFYRQGQAQGGFDEGIGLVIERILAGPGFLFVIERTPAGAEPGDLYTLPDIELATRLSLFLWSSVPDEELMRVAEAGALGNPEVLERQIRRMLEDPRSRALVENFASQWLTLRQLNAAAPNGELFPYFDDNLRRAFQKETRLFFEHILEEDRPLLEMLDADYTFINDRLAEHYDIPDVYGSHFRKVALSDGTRGGLLGQGSILTVTSYANRTSPVIRGKWVLENILSAPPPPPPPNVPGLNNKDEKGRVLTMREQMERHRANPVCASCHKVMDPLGFAMENYDAVGRWRTVDAASQSPIDNSGALPDGTTFEGPSGLRRALLEKRSYDFVMTAIEKLLTYALGRGIEHTDAPVMRSIMRQAAPEDYRLSALIMAIVESTPFQMRRVPDHADI